MEMDGEEGSTGDDMTVMGALVGGPVGGEDGGPVGCCGLCSCNVEVGCMLRMGNKDVGCPVVDPTTSRAITSDQLLLVKVLCGRVYGNSPTIFIEFT